MPSSTFGSITKQRLSVRLVRRQAPDRRNPAGMRPPQGRMTGHFAAIPLDGRTCPRLWRGEKGGRRARPVGRSLSAANDMAEWPYFGQFGHFGQFGQSSVIWDWPWRVWGRCLTKEAVAARAGGDRAAGPSTPLRVNSGTPALPAFAEAMAGKQNGRSVEGEKALAVVEHDGGGDFLGGAG